ncbi:hypothetical protein ABZP36_002914 [Zizania latifolia]
MLTRLAARLMPCLPSPYALPHPPLPSKAPLSLASQPLHGAPHHRRRAALARFLTPPRRRSPPPPRRSRLLPAPRRRAPPGGSTPPPPSHSHHFILPLGLTLCSRSQSPRTRLLIAGLPPSSRTTRASVTPKLTVYHQKTANTSGLCVES